MNLSQSSGDIRHHYSVCVRKADFGVAGRIYCKTPLLIAAQLLYSLGYCLAALCWFVLVVYVLNWISELLSIAGIYYAGILLGFAAPVYFSREFARRFLFPLRLAQIVRIALEITTPLPQAGRDSRPGPRGTVDGFSSPGSYPGQAVVMDARPGPSSTPSEDMLKQGLSSTARFRRSNVEQTANTLSINFSTRIEDYSQLKALVDGVVSEISPSLDWFAELNSPPGVQLVYQLFGRMLSVSKQYISDSVLSYCFARGEDNIYSTAADGLVFFVQRWQPILRTAVVVLAFEYLFTFGVFLIALAPASLLGNILPDIISVWIPVFALALALAVRHAVLHTLFFTMVALKFHIELKGKSFNAASASLLNKKSEKFAQLSQNALEWDHARSGF